MSNRVIEDAFLASNMYAKEKEIVEHFGITSSKLKKDRSQNQGFPYIKVGRSVLYVCPAITEYLYNRGPGGLVGGR